MNISKEEVSDWNWWIKELPTRLCAYAQIYEPNYVIGTDASPLVYGAYSNGRTAGDWWPKAIHHINWLEPKACSLALQSFFAKEHGISIHLKSDNAVAVAYLRNFEGVISPTLWMDIPEKSGVVYARKSWLTSTHLPDVQNNLADPVSRLFWDDWNGSSISNTSPLPKRDVVGLCLGKPPCILIQVEVSVLPYELRQGDPGSVYTDALSLVWSTHNCFYAFSPFSRR